MTVQQLKDLIRQGEIGEVVAVSYTQGVVDGLLGMESLRKKERNAKLDFCGIREAYNNNNPIRHPAFETKNIVKRWEQSGRPMNALAVDMVLVYLTDEYGC